MFDRKDKRVVEEPSIRKFKFICILGGKNIKKNKEFLSVIKELDQVLVARGINLVYGGGLQGLRRSMTITALIKRIKVLSVSIRELDTHYFVVSIELNISNLPKQLGYMFYNAKAFIV